MNRKFIIKDEDGKQFEVTETVDEEIENVNSDVEEIHGDEGLTSEEIALLKKLAAHADEIIASFSKPVEDTDEDEDEVVADEDIDEVNDCNEELVETKNYDSKSSFGSLEKRKTKDSISLDDKEQAIANAWADRYAQARKKGE